MLQETVAESNKSSLDTVSKMFADPPPLFNGKPVIFFEETFVRIINPFREPGGMEETIEEGKVSKSLTFDDLLEVKFDVSLAANEMRVAEESEGEPICHNSPEFFTPVEVFLDQGMGSEAGNT